MPLLLEKPRIFLIECIEETQRHFWSSDFAQEINLLTAVFVWRDYRAHPRNFPTIFLLTISMDRQTIIAPINLYANKRRESRQQIALSTCAGKMSANVIRRERSLSVSLFRRIIATSLKMDLVWQKKEKNKSDDIFVCLKHSWFQDVHRPSA